jgi:hypothetical protein
MKTRLIGSLFLVLVAQTSHGITQVAPVRSTGTGSLEITGDIIDINTETWKGGARIHPQDVPVNFTIEDNSAALKALQFNPDLTQIKIVKSDKEAAPFVPKETKTTPATEKVKSGYKKITANTTAATGKRFNPLIADMVEKSKTKRPVARENKTIDKTAAKKVTAKQTPAKAKNSKKAEKVTKTAKNAKKGSSKRAKAVA